MSKSSLISHVNRLLAQHAGRRTNGRQASHATATGTGQVLRTAFSDLWELGYRLEQPQNLGTRHVQALVQYWHQKPLAISTILERLSRLRVFCGWIGKGGMIKSLPCYLPHVDPAQLRAKRVARQSKSWSGAGIDLPDLLARADALDQRIGLMIRMQLWFGLRRKEVLHMLPWAHDEGSHLAVIEGKGGRPRTIALVHPGQRAVLDQVKAVVRPDEHLGWHQTARGQRATLKYNYGRYNKLLAALGLTRIDLGVTGHGARHQALENLMLTLGVVPATLGGQRGQLDPAQEKALRIRVSNAAGHNRPSITGAYCGTYSRAIGPNDATALGTAIQAIGPCAAPPPDTRSDCLRIVELLAGLGLDITLGQAHRLWQIASARFGVPWYAIPGDPAGLLRYAANEILARRAHHASAEAKPGDAV